MAEAALLEDPEDGLEVEVDTDGVDVEMEGPEGEVEVDPALGPKVKAEEEPEPEPAKAEPKKAVTAEEGIANFKARLEEEKQARTHAEERAAEYERKALTQRSEQEVGKYYQVTSALEAVTNQNKLTRQAFVEAQRAGDYEKVAELQMALSNEANALTQLQNGKQQWEAYLKNPNRHQQQAQQAKPAPQQQAKPAAPADPVEALASHIAQQGSPRSADWIRKNPDYARDPTLTRKMQQAHFSALGEDLTPETDAYFAHINSKLGVGKKVTAERKPAVPAAPTSRSASPTSSPKEKVVLSHAQLKFCRDSDTDPKVYAKNILRARARGQLTP